MVAVALVALAAAPAAFGAAVTHQADAVHSGHATVRGLNPPLHRVWSRAFPDVVSYPVIGSGRVFVTAFTTAADGNTRESEVVAMSLRTGRVPRRRPLGRGVGGQLGLEGDRLFVTRGGYEAPGVEAMFDRRRPHALALRARLLQRRAASAGWPASCTYRSRTTSPRSAPPTARLFGARAVGSAMAAQSGRRPSPATTCG